MSRKFSFLIFSILFLFIAACSNVEVRDDSVDDEVMMNEATFLAEVVENETGLLVTPLEGEPELNSADLFSVDVKDATLLDEEGNEIEVADLQVGMIVEIDYNGRIMESYPAQIISSKIEIVQMDE